MKGRWRIGEFPAGPPFGEPRPFERIDGIVAGRTFDLKADGTGRARNTVEPGTYWLLSAGCGIPATRDDDPPRLVVAETEETAKYRRSRLPMAFMGIPIAVIDQAPERVPVCPTCARRGDACNPERGVILSAHSRTVAPVKAEPA